jgi:methyl coenzyme M reductase subunit C-like uncharacterized protein (methanogenesis marker protein 7)
MGIKRNVQHMATLFFRHSICDVSASLCHLLPHNVTWIKEILQKFGAVTRKYGIPLNILSE